jgi:hypothetical protein
VPLLDRIRSFLATPQGRRLTDQGRRFASDPPQQPGSPASDSTAGEASGPHLSAPFHQRQVRDLMARLRRH